MLFGRVQRKTVDVVAIVAGLFLALRIGSMIADHVQPVTPGMNLLCLGGPLVVVAAVLWLIGRLI